MLEENASVLIYDRLRVNTFDRRCSGSLLIQEKAANRTSVEPNLWSSSSLFMGIAQTYHERF
jgi:hypothetical protein